jgi:chromosome segregation ATPase
MVGYSILDLHVRWTSDINRIKSDVESFARSIETMGARVDSATGKTTELEHALSLVRKGLEQLEAASVRDFVSATSLERYKREVDTQVLGAKELVYDELEKKLKPFEEKLSDHGKQLAEFKLQLNSLLLKVSLGIAVVTFVAAKGVDFLIKLAAH